jgi:amino acid transporter
MATIEARPQQRLTRPVERTERGLRRDVGLTSLMFVSVGSIIGSGWLFGALYASQQAGPAALVSWGLGAVFMLALALVHAELGGAYPVSGGTARFPHYSHGSTVGYAMGWLWWLGAVTVAPIEVEAALQYFTHYVSWLTTTSGSATVLTTQGYIVAVVLMAVFTVINVLGVRWLAETNKIVVWWKILVPAVTVIALVATSRHGSNFSAAGGFMPYGWKGVLLALSSGGVVFACAGFEQAVQLGGESRRPGRNIPLAMIGAIVLTLLLYIALQVAFIAALDPSTLSDADFDGLLVAAGLAGGEDLDLPDRMAEVNAMLDLASPRMREALLVAFLDRLQRPAR